MFKKINAKLNQLKKLIHHNIPQRLTSSSGQIAVILMLVIAAALIFYAVSLNVGKLSHSKTMVTMAANAGASKMASQMASYGQVLFMETLGGKKRVCGLTGIAAAIVSIVVTVICIIIIAFSYGSGTPAVAALWMAVVGLALSIVSLILQITYIQPGITAMWNKIIAETLDMADQFVENGIQAALSTSVSDSAAIPDLDDLDSDTIFGFHDPDGNGRWDPIDEYSRYAFYYTERLKTIEVMSASIMIDFQNALRDFVYEDVNTDWGIYDPPNCGTNCCYFGPGVQVDSYCNPCCMPLEISDPTDTTGDPAVFPTRATCCDSGDAGQCGEASTCIVGLRSPFLGGNAGDFPWVYDAYHENYDNTFVSFMEQLGWDDEHTDYRKNMAGMSTALGPGVVTLDYIDGLPQVDDSVAVGGLGDYRIEDTSGFVGMDGKGGIFSYLWKLMEWGTDLNDLAFPPGCQWCDEDQGGAGMNTCPVDHSPMWEQLQISLPLDPTDPNAPVFDPSYCVDPLANNQGGNYNNGRGRTFPYPPVAPDNITIPSNILAADDVCAQEMYYYDASDLPVENEMQGFWKPGADRYCNRTASPGPPSGEPTGNSMTWPYYGDCPGKGSYMDPIYNYPIPCTCEDVGGDCPAATRTAFNEDVLDDLVYGLPEFVQWAEQILEYTPTRLVRDFPGWYPDAADWIEPPSPPATSETDPPCYICGTTTVIGDPETGPHVGYLYIWMYEMDAIADRVDRWLENDGDNFNYRGDASFTNGAGNDVWCVPNNTTAAQINTSATNCLSSTERAAIEGTGFDSSLISAESCLSWNVTDHWGGALDGDWGGATGLPPLPADTPTNPDVGNWAKFHACSEPDWCRDHEALCQEQLGRSLAPDFCTDHGSTSAFRDAIPADETVFEQCLETLQNRFPPTSYATHQTAVPSNGAVDQPPKSGATDLGDGGYICGTVNSDICGGAGGGGNLGRDVRYLANHDCETECDQAATLGSGGQYVEALVDWDPPTYSSGPADDILGSVSCNWTEMVPTYFPATCFDAQCWGGGCTPTAGQAEVVCGPSDPPTCVPSPEIPPGDCTPSGGCGGECNEANCEANGGSCQVNTAPDPACTHECGHWADVPTPRVKTCNYYREQVLDAGDCVSTDADGFETQITRAQVLAGGSCFETVANEFCRGCFFDSAVYGSPVPRSQKRFVGFNEAVMDARDEAINQMEKLEYRQTFINERIVEMQEIQTMMEGASDEFEDFLTGPAEDLIRARIAYDLMEDKGLPYHAVYGWQDDPPEDAEPGRVGQWHIVRVDARSPSRCDNACSTDYSQSGNWPRVKTYSKSWGMERCYELTDTDGRVKMRVTRYDEPIFYGSGGGGASESRNKSRVLFPGGRKLWDFRSDLPLDDPNRPNPSANNLGLTCQDSMPDDPPGLPHPYSAGGEKAGIYEGAFLLNNPWDDTECWARAARLLTHGVSTETCAEYYYHDGLVPGFSVRFVNCPGESGHEHLTRFPTHFTGDPRP